MALWSGYWPRPWDGPRPGHGQILLLEIHVRILIAAVAALLAVGVASPVLALAPLTAGPEPASIVQRLPDGDAAGPAVVRKKKKESVTIKSVTGARKGKNGLKIKVKVAKADRVCEMELQWNDGSS